MSTESENRTMVKGSPAKFVRLNVGGNLFLTTFGTLIKQPGLLCDMFSGDVEVLTDQEGWILVYRSGKHFGTILNFLRDGACPFPDKIEDLKELIEEAQYYRLGELHRQAMVLLQRRAKPLFPKCMIALSDMTKEEKDIVVASNKPVIKLQVNRSNNKYSYTTHSDDHLLKNIELFDKLSLRFHGRVLFLRTLYQNNEICCWSFFANGKKVSEISCTSIVYTSEKKQTKVEFPEARIYEETLNVLLYENSGGVQCQAESESIAVSGRPRERDTRDEHDDSWRRVRHALANSERISFD